MTRLASQLRRFALASVVLGLIVGLDGQARADLVTTLYNTGVDSSGTPLASGTIGDPHYSLISAPPGTPPVEVYRDGSGYPLPPDGPYLGDDSLSAWIGNNSGDAPVGDYDYRTTFNLTGFESSTAQINGIWATDDFGLDILINGVSTGNVVTSSEFTAWTSFSITSGFLPGVNTLDFLVENANLPGFLNPTGLRVEMTGNANVVPEPSTVAMIATGLPLGLGFWCWNRRRAAATSTTTT